MRQRLLTEGRGLLPILALAILLAGKQLAVVAAAGIPAVASMLPGSLAPVLLLAPLLVLVPARRQLLALLCLDLAVSALLVADLVHFRIFGEMTTAAALANAGQLSDVSDSVADVFRPFDLLPLLELPLVAALVLRGKLGLPRPTLATAAAASLVAVLTLVGVVWADPTRTHQHRGSSRMIGRWGLLSFHGRDLYAELSRRLEPRGTSPERLAAISSLVAGRKNQPGPLWGVARGKNLIVIQVESLMAFARGLSVGGAPVTPVLDGLAEESLRFGEFFEHTGTGLTADADVAANCSLLPLRAGAVYALHGSAEYRCLPAILASVGYDTAAFQAIRPDFWNLSVAYPRVGFARFHHLGDYDASGGLVGLGLSDQDALAQTGPKLAALREPFHAFVVTITSHHPYAYPGIPRMLPLGPLEGEKLGAYLDAIHNADAALGTLLKSLRKDGLLDRSVLAIYGDHRGLGVAGNPLAAKLAGIDHGNAGARVLMDRRIPLLIRLPGGAHAGDVATLGGQVDLPPTLAALLGVDPGPAPWLGQDLLGTGGERLVAVFDGTAISAERIFGAGPGKERCLARADGRSLPAADCAREAESAALAIDASGDIVRLDLVPALLAAPAEPAGSNRVMDATGP